MKVIEGSRFRSKRNWMGVVFDGVFVSVKRGLSFGIVLFLALTTLSVLNRGVDYLTSVKNRIQEPQGHTRNFLVSRSPVSSLPGYSSKPDISGQRVISGDKVLRESGYLLNELERLVRSVGRFVN